MIVIASYLVYLLISVSITIWVARTLHRNGRIFLVDSLGGNELLADSVNQLLVAGFYLINVGYVCAALQFGDKPHNPAEGIEYLSTKLGIVLLVLGAMHFLNIAIFSSMRRRAIEGVRPPVQPSTRIAPPAGV